MRLTHARPAQPENSPGDIAMLTIPQLLDLAKKRNNIPSDRKLGLAIGRANLAPYRTKGEIPNDDTAIKLAELCGLPPHEVLLTCHILKAGAGESPEVHTEWKHILKMVSNACIAAVFVAGLTYSPAGARAAVHPHYDQNIHYATLLLASLLLCLISFKIRG